VVIVDWAEPSTKSSFSRSVLVTYARGALSHYRVKILVKLQNLGLLKLQMNSIHQWLMFP